MINYGEDLENVRREAQERLTICADQQFKGVAETLLKASKELHELHELEKALEDKPSTGLSEFEQALKARGGLKSAAAS